MRRDIQIILLKNPFNPSDAEISYCSFVPDKTAYQHVAHLMMGNNFIVSVNGNIVDETYVPQIGDFIAVCASIEKGGGVKKILGIIAMIALSVYAGNIAGGLWGTGANTLASGLLAGAVMSIGGALINSIFPSPKADNSNASSSSSSNTTAYGWGNDASQIGQGHPLATTFGSMRTRGSILSQHIFYEGNKQYLAMILTGGEGPIDSIADVRINDNPISNYSGVVLETRLGTNDQPVLSDPVFSKGYADKNLSYELIAGHDWSTDVTEGNGGEGLEIGITFPNGLYRIDDQGNNQTAWVKLEAQYRLVGTETWNSFYNRDASTTEKYIASTGGLSSVTALAGAKAETWTVTFQKGGMAIPTSIVGSVSGAVPFTRTSPLPNTWEFNNGFISFRINWYKDAPAEALIGGSVKIVVGNVGLSSITISALNTSSFTKVYSINDLPVGKYEVRTRCTAKSGSGNRDVTRVGWSQITQVINTNFARVGKTVVALKILATDQLSGGIPTVSWLQSRDTVNVWNPDTLSYELRPANSPAWASYDIIHHCRKLRNINTGLYEFTIFGKPARRLSYHDFKKWADYCETVNLKFNYIFSSVYDFWGALKLPEAVGRGKVLLRGTSYSAICDMPSSPVQMFSIGNIGQGEFKLTYLPLKDRADAVEISFSNKDKDYQKDPIVIYGDAYDTSESAQNPTQITLEGCVDYKQAYLAGKYYLRLNKYLLRTITFPADIDAIACQAGDVILVNHDTLNMDADSEQTGSGRVISATNNTLVLDREIKMSAGKEYGVHVQCKDGTILVKNVIHSDELTSVITIDGEFTTIPERFDIYGFGEIGKVTRPYRVASITRSGELKRSITALEYFDEIYDEDGIIPDRYLNDSSNFFPVVLGATFTQEYYIQGDGYVVSNLNSTIVFPTYSNITKVSVYYSLDEGVSWTYAGYTNSNLYSLHNVKTKTNYKLKFIAEDSLGMSGTPYISESVYITGKDNPPSNVLSLTIAQAGVNLSVSITKVSDPDIKYYELRYGSTWMNSVKVAQFIDSQIYIEAPKEGTLTYWVKAIDNSGGESEVATKAIVNVSGLPKRNIIMSESFPMNTWTHSGMYLENDGLLHLSAIKKTSDFEHWADMFGNPVILRNDAYVDLPIIDLGANILDFDVFYYDRYGIARLKTVQKIGDFVTFGAIFDSPLTYVVPKYAVETMVGVEVDYVENPAVRVDYQFSSSLDLVEWTGRLDSSVKQFSGRYLKIRLIPVSSDRITQVIIKGVKVIVDVPDVEDVLTNVALNAGVNTVNFNFPFTQPPAVAVFTEDSSGKSITSVITNITKNGFDIELLDSNGNSIAGYIIQATMRGY